MDYLSVNLDLCTAAMLPSYPSPLLQKKLSAWT
uniref:Uncharacterized protein n=1 Tax=Arundo donax TaxID=35708 RepID=A0A0A8ZBL9_ARUDO